MNALDRALLEMHEHLWDDQAGMVRLYVHDGTTSHIYRELPVAAISASGSTAAHRSEILTPDLRLPTTGYELRASTNNAEPFRVHALAGDY